MTQSDKKMGKAARRDVREFSVNFRPYSALPLIKRTSDIPRKLDNCKHHAKQQSAIVVIKLLIL